MPQVKYPRFKAAACHAASVYLDTNKTIDKACDWIAEAAQNGASLIAFPEAFVPAFPIWAALQAPIHSHEFFRLLVSQALKIDGPELHKVRAAAKTHGVIVSIGITEGTDASVGCIWNTNVIIGSDGNILSHHRKLMPTYFEKLIWAPGDGRGLRVVNTEIGRLGMLICGENTNPLARYSLIAQGEQVHVSSYPPTWPTRPVTQKGGYDLRRAIEIRAGAHSFEGKLFNVVASGVIDLSMRDALANMDKGMIETLERSPRPVSMVLDPSGNVISEVLSENEGILYADIDVAACVEPKQFHDVVGYYNRFDVFSFGVDRRPLTPATFIDKTGNDSETESPKLTTANADEYSSGHRVEAAE